MKLDLTASQVGLHSLRHLLTEALADGKIATTDTVWRAPDGSITVTASASYLNDPEYADYSEVGDVAEYLD